MRASDIAFAADALVAATEARVSRRTFLRGAGALGLGVALGRGTELEAAPRARRGPDSLPNPLLPEGTDTLVPRSFLHLRMPARSLQRTAPTMRD